MEINRSIFKRIRDLLFIITLFLLFSNNAIAQCPVDAGFTYVQDCNDFDFTDTSTVSMGSIDSVYWDFGDGDVIKLYNPPFDTSYSYSSEGEYYVTLYVYHDKPCADSITDTISYFNPVADFWADTVCFGDSTQFYNTSSFVTYQIETVFWDFGDGYYSNDYEPKHLYKLAGVDTAKLVVYNSIGCVDSVEYEVRVDSLPVADLIVPDSACTGLEVCLTDLSIANADSLVQWLWQFGDGNYSNAENPCHSYMEQGEYEITHAVANSNGCISAIIHDTITVIDKLIPLFNASQACFGDSTYFINETDTTGVEVLFWEWNFDDPTSGSENVSDLMHPTHRFTHAGLFDVRLVVANLVGCTDTIINTIVVDTLPEAEFDLPNTVTVNSEVVFEDLSVSHGSLIFFRYWDFGDGSPVITNPNPIVHTYTEPGTFDVCLVVQAINGCMDTMCHPITVLGLPFVDFTYTSSELFITSFTDISTAESDLVNWYWDFGDPFNPDPTIQGEPNPIWNYQMEGFYYVFLEVTDEYGGKHDTTKQIYAGKAVVADFDFVTICYNNPAIFIDSSFSPIQDKEIETWYWDFGDGTDTTYNEYTNSLRHYYESVGIYNAQLIVYTDFNGNEISDTLFKEVGVNHFPIAFFEDSLGVCLGTVSEFFDDSETIGSTDIITDWLWVFGDGDSSNFRNPDHLYDTTGIYDVQLIVTTNHGCSDTISKDHHVNYAPEIGFDIINNCLNAPTYFIPRYDSSKIEIFSWYWEFDDPFSDTTSTDPYPSHVYSSIRSYSPSLTASTYGCYGKVDTSFLVYPTPYSNYTISPDLGGVQGRTLFNNQSIFATYYYWDFGNGNSSTVDNPIEVYEMDSLYTVTLISYNEYDCSDTSRYEHLVFFKGLYFPTAFSPNNPNSEISLFTPKGINLAEYHVQVYDLKGSVLWESKELDEYGSPIESWDGYYNDILMPQGTYIWKAIGLFKDGSLWKGSVLQSKNPQTQGTFTLVR